MRRRWTRRRPRRSRPSPRPLSRAQRERGSALPDRARCAILWATASGIVDARVEDAGAWRSLLLPFPRDKPLATPAARRARFSLERILSPLLLAPSAVAIFIFVYGFIGYTFYVSLTNWKSAKPDMSIRQPLGAIYRRSVRPDPISDRPSQYGRLHVAFLFLAVLGGLGLAILLDRHIAGSGFFRSVFFFPYALSFITTGVAWRWIFNPETGVNAADRRDGHQRRPGGVRRRSAQSPAGSPIRPSPGNSTARSPRSIPPAGDWSPQTGRSGGHDPGGHRRGLAALRVRHGDVPGRSGHDLARGAGSGGAGRGERLSTLQGRHHPAAQTDHGQHPDHPDARLARRSSTSSSPCRARVRGSPPTCRASSSTR